MRLSARLISLDTSVLNACLSLPGGGTPHSVQCISSTLVWIDMRDMHGTNT